jgi:Predicted ATPase
MAVSTRRIVPELIAIDEKRIVLRIKEKGLVLFIKKEKSGYIVDVWTQGSSLKLDKYILDSSLVGLQGIPDPDLQSIIAHYISNWDLFLEGKIAEVLLSDSLAVIPRRPTDKEILAYELAKRLVEERGATALYVEVSRGKSLVGIFCYDRGHYYACEDEITTFIKRYLHEMQMLRVGKDVIDNVIKVKIPALNPVFVRESQRPLIAFENGLFDWEEFIMYGDLERALRPFDKSVVVLHKIPHSLNIDMVKQVRQGLEKYIPPRSCRELLEVLRAMSQRVYELVKSWAWYDGVTPELLESRMCFILQMIGRALFPGYRLFGSIMFKDIFVLLGPTNSGKTTFLVNFMGEQILGKRNYSVVALSSLAHYDPEDVRRACGSLFNVLAVLMPDVSRRQRVYDWSLVRTISGGDPVEARRLRENIFWYYPAYKIYMASNDPPEIREEGEARRALLNRIKAIEFKNRFKGDLNLEQFLKEEDREAVIIASIYALRIAYYQGYAFTGVSDIEDLWLRYSVPVYRWVMEMVEKGLLKLDPSLSISSDDLYQLVIDYVREEVKKSERLAPDEEPEVGIPDQRSFTVKLKQHLARFGVKTINKHGKRYFKSIGVPPTHTLT